MCGFFFLPLVLTNGGQRHSAAHRLRESDRPKEKQKMYAGLARCSVRAYLCLMLWNFLQKTCIFALLLLSLVIMFVSILQPHCPPALLDRPSFFVPFFLAFPTCRVHFPSSPEEP